MFESRCGVCCSDCNRREQVKCKGCTEMPAPFWGGICEVKKCCENKKLNHCGQCTDFPCKTAADMGKEQGHDPEPRLTKCREWAKK